MNKTKPCVSYLAIKWIAGIINAAVFVVELVYYHNYRAAFWVAAATVYEVLYWMSETNVVKLLDCCEKWRRVANKRTPSESLTSLDEHG